MTRAPVTGTQECIRRPNAVWTTCPCPPCARDRRRIHKLHRNGHYRRPAAADAWAVIFRWIDRDWSGLAMASAVGVPPVSMRSVLDEYRAAGHQRHLGPILTAKIIAAADRHPTAGLISALGARRRLQALAVKGWSLTALTPATGLPTATLSSIRSGATQRVNAAAANAIRTAYDRLAEHNGGDARARTLAATNGWAPPAQWDDPDDPADGAPAPSVAGEVDEMAVARAVAGDRPDNLRAVDRQAAVAELSAYGWSLSRMAERLRVTERTIERDREALGLVQHGKGQAA